VTFFSVAISLVFDSSSILVGHRVHFIKMSRLFAYLYVTLVYEWCLGFLKNPIIESYSSYLDFLNKNKNILFLSKSPPLK
jgi:hypothetical protein